MNPDYPEYRAEIYGVDRDTRYRVRILELDEFVQGRADRLDQRVREVIGRLRHGGDSHPFHVTYRMSDGRLAMRSIASDTALPLPEGSKALELGPQRHERPAQMARWLRARIADDPHGAPLDQLVDLHDVVILADETRWCVTCSAQAPCATLTTLVMYYIHLLAAGVDHQRDG